MITLIECLAIRNKELAKFNFIKLNKIKDSKKNSKENLIINL